MTKDNDTATDLALGAAVDPTTEDAIEMTEAELKERHSKPTDSDAGPEDDAYRQRAIEVWSDDDLQIDGDATVSVADAGAWVQAWVWVSD